MPAKDFVELLWVYLRPQWKWVVVLFLVLVVNVGLTLWAPMILRKFLDAIAVADASGPTNLAAFFVLVSLAKRVSDPIVGYLSSKIGWTSTNALREDLVNHCVLLDMGFHHEHSPGEMIERVDGDVNSLNNFFSLFVIQILSNSLLLCGIVVIVWMVHWQIGIAFALFSALTFAVCNVLRHRGVHLQFAARKSSAEVTGFLEERIGATEDLSSCSASPYTLLGFRNRLRDWFLKDLKAGMYLDSVLNMAWTSFYVANAAALGLGAYYYLNGFVTIGFVYLLYQYASMLRQPIEGVVRELENLTKVGASIARLKSITNRGSRIRDGRGAAIPSGPLSVTFDGVSFSYNNSKLTLNSISFHLAAGRVLGLVGRTGCGKTTLSRLLFRFYDPGEGCVCLGGVDVRESSLHDLRRRVSLVTQNVHFFAGTIRDNLTFFDKSIDDSRILEALTDLCLDDWITGLPDGLETKISSGGGGLSAGEGQLLALARVLIKDDAGLVVLDEPSSRLDQRTEHRIETAIKRLVRNRTAVIIAHRLSTLHWVDDIMVINDGSIVEYDERRTLISRSSSIFSEMVEVGRKV